MCDVRFRRFVCILPLEFGVMVVEVECRNSLPPGVAVRAQQQAVPLHDTSTIIIEATTGTK
jgi:hypothetical protein